MQGYKDSNIMKFNINLLNCFGIRKLDNSFDLSRGNFILIYAHNGTMKTSLARTFLCAEENHNAADLLDESNESSYSFTLNGNAINHNQIFVCKTEDNQIEPNDINRLEEESILSFISPPELIRKFNETKEPLDLLIEQINKKFNTFVCGRKLFFSEEIMKLYHSDGILGIYESFLKLFLEFSQYDFNGLDFKGIYYDYIFDKHGVSIKYINTYYDNLLYLNGKKRDEVTVDGKKRWNRLCNIIDSNPRIKEKLNDLELLRKEYMFYFISRNIESFQTLCNQYKESKNELQLIINEVNSDTELWDNVITVFNNRFSVPYRLYLENKADALLNKDFLRLKYYNVIESKEYRGKETFLNFISTGEKRAYYLLLNLFEIEKRKQRNEQEIIVIDDIIDSFDYKNKYAIVEYLAELKQHSNFIVLILTHNFDFYRTISSRLCLNNIFIAIRDEERNITLKDGQYVRDVFKNVLIRNLNKIDHLISSIPFVRNIVEYTKGIQSYDYKELCRFLHFKEEIRNLTLEQLSDLIYSNVYVEQKREKTSGNYLEALRREADYAYESKDEISIVNKLLLSIAIRLNAEAFAFNKLRLKLDFDIEDIHDYTFTLFEKYRQCFPEKTEESLILTRVTMMTSENIHLNNFMFEPIIDMSSEHLKRLYKEVKSLNGTE